jgi:hypothetical protein
MAGDNEYKQLKLKVQRLSQEILQEKKATATYKDIIEDPKTSDKDRKKYKEMYDASIADARRLQIESSATEKELNKVLGKTSLDFVNKKYNNLKKELDIQLDPNSKKAKSIQKEIDALVPEYQDAYSKSIGTQISAAVAKNKMVKGNIPSLGDNAQVTPASSQTPATTLTKPTSAVTPGKLPAKKEEKPLLSNLPGKLPETPVAINPVTGEKIKVSDIKPAKGQPTTPAVVGPNALPPVDKTGAALNIIEDKFALSQALFNNVPGLKTIYEKYIDPKSGMTDDEFIKLVRQDTWYRKNSKEIKARFVQFYNYQDMKNSGQADGSTDYEMQIKKIENNLRKNAAIMGSDVGSDPNALTKMAENLYITNRSEDESFITDLLATSIRPINSIIGGKPTLGYSGEALRNYTALLQTARDNGFQMSDILPGGANEQQVLAGIASGKIDIGRVAQDARKLAAQGQPQYVRDLLSQGYNLSQVFAPYRQTMATVLDIQDPNQIDLNDPLLRTAITDKGDMNLYDFKKALRQDSRWQYTEQAKADVSQAALGVLRDFGFQG